MTEPAATEVREYTTSGRVSRMGRTTIVCHCPFCGEETVAYLWSLCGSGKKCACGAKFNGFGTASKAISAPLT